MTPRWDLLVVGAGPAGCATALGALQAGPGLRVALLDRAGFPRDKACGDGVAAEAIDLLRDVGVSGLVDDWRPVRTLRLSRDGHHAARAMARPAWVVPRAVLDHRLLRAAQQAGATLVRHRVRSVQRVGGAVVVDDRLQAPVLVGADGAQSVVRRSMSASRPRTAIALRGYAPTPPERRGAQVIAFRGGRRPGYAWSFDRGDGLANVGYGEILAGRRAHSTRADMLSRLEALLPGAAHGAGDWRGAQLPLAGWHWRPPGGPVLLAGDAAGVVNPMTGEGIYDAVATGLAAGRAAAEAIAAGRPEHAGVRYRAAVRSVLARHQRHAAAAASLCRHGAVLEAGLRASAADQQIFDDLVELGLARGTITARLVRGLARELVRPERATAATEETG